MFLNDQETAVDLLYYESIAKTVVKLIRKTPNAPVTVGVHGDWGAGKSSILKMTAAAFEEEERHLCLWFNGWTFEGFEDAKTVVMETIIDELRRARPNSTKVKDAAKKLLKRVDWLKVAKKAGGFAFTAMTGVPTLDQMQGLLNLAQGFLAKPQDHISRDDISAFAGEVGNCIKSEGDEADHLPTQIHAFREEFQELLEAADLDQLVVIVDDLDRCLPETAIATLEAIRLFLFVPKTAFVIGADETMIEYAVRNHFPDLPNTGAVSYARNYLEKLVQVPFRIPSLGHAETKIYITLLLVENALGAQDADFQKLMQAAKEELRHPWTSKGLDREAVGKALGKTLPPAVDTALTVSTQISRILTEGTKGNPRQIKRFLNSMMLRQEIAEAREIKVDRAVLAKIMLAERFSTDFYDQIGRSAAADNNGKSEILAELENSLGVSPPIEKKSLAAKADKKSDKNTEPESPAVSSEAQDLLKSEWTKSWVKISPALKGEDLRPYFFITRDKRTYAGGIIPLSHLDNLIERLMGTKIAARSAMQDVLKLSGNDPDQLFDALTGRILNADDLKNAPDGVQGLIVLVEAHSTLQPKLLGFVQNLPVDKVGAWAASSWGSCLKDAATLASFDKKLEEWSQQTSNGSLRAAAQGARKLKQVK